MDNFQKMSQRNRTSGMVESSILLAIMMVLIIAGVYLPIIGGFAMLAQPGVLFLIMARQGMRWGVLATVASFMLATILVGPLQALGLFLSSFLPGIIFAWLVYRKYSISWVMLGSTFAFWLGMVAGVALSVLVMGMDISPETIEAQMNGFIAVNPMYANMPPEQLAQAKALIPLMAQMFLGILGVFLLFISMLMTYLNYWITAYLARRFAQIQLETFPPFYTWTFPKWLGTPFLIVMIAGYYAQFQQLIPPVWMINLGLGICLISGFFMLLQGFAVFRFLFEAYRVPRFIFLILIIATFLLPVISITAIFTGIADLFLDYRKLKKKS